MSFLLPLAEVGAFIGEALAEIGVSQEVATAGGAFAAGKIGSEVDKAASNLIPDKAKQIGADFYKAALDTSGAYNTSNINYFINRQRKSDPKPKPKISGGNLSSPKPVIKPEEIASLVVGHSDSIANAGITDHLTDIIPNLSLTDSNGSPVQSTSTNQEIVKDLVGNDSSKLGIIQKLSNFYADKSVSNSEEFKKIYEIYTGVGFEPRNVIMSENKFIYKFDMIDEVGSRIHLEQDKNAYTLPSVISGYVFAGPKSRNNSLPINVPDTAFLAHDADYGTLGYFHWEADQKLISRLLQRRASWPVKDVKAINNTIVYFSTLGASLAKLKGSITSPTSVSVDSVTDDIFPVANPDAFEERSTDPEVYASLRSDFYTQLEGSVEKEHMQLQRNGNLGNIQVEIF